LVLLLVLAQAPMAWADVSMEQRRQLVEQGEVLPLETILQQLQQQRPGHAIEVELEYKGGRYIYEIEWLDPEGRVWELKVDARSGELLQQGQDD